jgi:protein phosphatase 2C family protein 2/3
VLSRRGKAVDLSRDHKPWSARERKRIEEVGGYVEDGYLNGQLGVARALGDWHMEGLKGDGGPLSAEPEIEEAVLSQGDEFLIIGCDGLWDVLSSQMAVDFARRRLQQHNDPHRCCRDLVAEALRRDSCDNLTVILVCFQPQPPPRFDSFSSSSSSSSSSLLVRKSISSHGLRSLQSVLDNLLHT